MDYQKGSLNIFLRHLRNGLCRVHKKEYNTVINAIKKTYLFPPVFFMNHLVYTLRMRVMPPKMKAAVPLA